MTWESSESRKAKSKSPTAGILKYSFPLIAIATSALVVSGTFFLFRLIDNPEIEVSTKTEKITDISSNSYDQRYYIFTANAARPSYDMPFNTAVVVAGKEAEIEVHTKYSYATLFSYKVFERYMQDFIVKLPLCVDLKDKFTINATLDCDSRSIIGKAVDASGYLYTPCLLTMALQC